MDKRHSWRLEKRRQKHPKTEANAPGNRVTVVMIMQRRDDGSPSNPAMGIISALRPHL
jgi:hypothetical protein